MYKLTEIYPDIPVITSKNNKKIIEYSKLSNTKYRNESSLFLCEGIKLSKEALEYCSVREVLISEFSSDEDSILEIVNAALEKDVRVTLLSDDVFSKVSTEQSPQGVICITEFPSSIHRREGFEEWQKGKRLLVLDEIRDPGNLGTVLRSAEAFGIEGILLINCADIYNPKVVRAAMGTLFRMPLFVSGGATNELGILKDYGRRIIGATLGENTVTLGQYDLYKDDCVVIGNEGHGISAPVMKECTFFVKIPMAGCNESLNASAAAVCIMWEYFRTFSENIEHGD